jgi:thioredoxin-related protein
MIKLWSSVFAVSLAVIAAGTSRAALDMSPPNAAKSEFELVVVEAPDCIYCHIFHRDVVPAYERSPRAETLPMRFVDVNEDAIKSLDLSRPIDSIPTVLVIKDQHEVGRIPGYVGPLNFFMTIDRLLAEAE